MKRRRWLHQSVSIGFCVVLSACANGLRLEDLPEEPIVFVHLTEHEARENREVANAKKDLGAGLLSDDQKNRIVPNSAELKSIFGVVEMGKPLTQGRVTLFFPKTGELRPLDSVLRGAWPHEWNRAHTQLVFSYRPNAETRSQLYAFDAVRGEVRQLTFGNAFHPFAGFATDGRIAVSVGEDVLPTAENAPPYRVKLRWLETDLRLSEPLVEYSAQQKEQMQIWAETHPALSPDGKFIVFEALDVRSDRSSILVWDATQSAQPPRFLARGSDPVFTPDGQWIVYAGPSRTAKQTPGATPETKLWRIRPDGSGRTQIGEGRASEREPAVSPDGKFIVYTVEEGDRLHLYIKRFDGSGERVLFSDGDGSLPVW